MSTLLIGKKGVMMSEAKELDPKNILQVRIISVKPNPMFEPWQHETTKFLRYSHTVECAECGRRSKHHWTSLLSFKAMDMSGKTPGPILTSATDKVHAPLTPVCGSHPLALAEMPPLSPRKRQAKARS